MYTSNPPMLPPGTVHIDVSRSIHSIPAQEDPFTVLVGLEEHRDSKRLEPCSLRFPFDQVNSDDDRLIEWLRGVGLIEFSSIISNEEHAGVGLRKPVSVYKPLTLHQGAQSKTVLDLVAIPYPDQFWRFTLVSRTGFVPMLEEVLRGREPNQRVYADIGVTLNHIPIPDRGLAICQWLMMQGYGIMSFASDGEVNCPMYFITVKTPWADRLLTERGF